MGDASDTAQEALVLAHKALTRIEMHEAECGKRWSAVQRLMQVAILKLGALLAFLIADKLGWVV